MKRLLILRHAKSSWSDQDRDDFDRPLNARGKADALTVGQHLASRELTPDLILCSSARRTRKTAKRIAEVLACKDRVHKLDAFYLAPAETYLETLRELPEQLACVLVIGHNPGIEDFVSRLTGEPRAMTTAALAVVALPIDHWSQLEFVGAARLESFWSPQ